jgi:hypothetical protein
MLTLEQFTLQYITSKSGENTAVILPIKEFLELLEDLDDLAIMAERREEPTIFHHDLLTELKHDDLIPN